LEWLEAVNANGEVLPGGIGWAVPDSRVNHSELEPPMIEVQVYHFSAAQAAVIVVDSGSGGGAAGSSSGGGGGGACFIGSAAASIKLPGSSGLFRVLGMIAFFIWLSFFEARVYWDCYFFLDKYRT
jgi:hypothetical protein